MRARSRGPAVCHTPQVSFWAINPSGTEQSALYATFGSSLQPVNLASSWTLFSQNARACGNDKFRCAASRAAQRSDSPRSVVSYNIPKCARRLALRVD